MIECCGTPRKVDYYCLREQRNLYLLNAIIQKIKFNLSLKNLNSDVIFVSFLSTAI